MVQRPTDKIPEGEQARHAGESRASAAKGVGGDSSQSAVGKAGKVAVEVGAAVASRIAGSYSKEPGRRKLQITTTVLLGIMFLGYVMRSWFGIDAAGETVYEVGLMGLVGFGTNWVAIKMLFHPRRRIFGLQGVFPRKKAELARDAARLMEERLISGDRLHKWLESTGAVSRVVGGLVGQLPTLSSGESLRPVLLNAGRDFVDQALPGLSIKLRAVIEQTVRDKVPSFMAGGVVSMIQPLLEDAERKIAAHLKDEATLNALVDKITPKLQEVVTNLLKQPGAGQQLEKAATSAIVQLFAEMRVADLLEREILAQSDEEIERMVNAAASEQLVFLQVAGGVIGCIAGLALTWPILLLVCAVPILFLMLMSRSSARE